MNKLPSGAPSRSIFRFYRLILSRVRHGARNKWLLLASSLSTPGRSAANVSRFRAPCYRDPDVRTTGGENVIVGAP